jgi:hypothetical protein
MVIQIGATFVADRRIINAIKRRQFSENSYCNVPQKAKYCEVQQYYIEYNSKQYIVVEHCGKNYYVNGLVLFVYEFSFNDFPLQEFMNTNSFSRSDASSILGDFDTVLTFKTL